jgi:SOS-response transcriptional repressor LexA
MIFSYWQEGQSVFRTPSYRDCPLLPSYLSIGKTLTEDDPMLRQLELLDTPKPAPRDIVQPLTGFIQAAEFTDTGIDLRRFLIGERNMATFVYQADDNEQMTGAGIAKGDLLVVDRSMEWQPGHLVVVLGELGHMVCRVSRQHGRCHFQKEILADIEIVPVTERIIEIVGVIKRTVQVRA